MHAAKLQVKVYLDPGTRVAPERVIPVFHSWIKNHVFDELLVDVANYAHVHDGPGVALIGHGSDYFLEETGGRQGLLYSRKREPPPPGERLRDAFRRALVACQLLEKDASLATSTAPRFATGEFLFRINDRLAAPNTGATLAAVAPELETFCQRLFAGSDFKLAIVGTPKQLFSVRITAGAPASEVSTLLGRLGA